jgi:hypothetical protein
MKKMKLQSYFPPGAGLRRGWMLVAAMLGVLGLLSVSLPAQTYFPSTNDLWDISQGSVVTGTSGVNAPFSDIRDMFGGQFSEEEPGNTVFADGKPVGFVHYVEWQTTAPVTVGSFVLFASGDGAGAPFPTQREFAQFALKAKSSPAATNYDLTLYTLVVTNHPYTFLDPAHYALVAPNITPVTAQYFRAEFTQYDAGNGYDGPRIVELDGFGPSPQVCDASPSGLVSWWAAEGNANDSFGTNNGTLLGGMSFANGKVGQAFQFDGATGNVRIPASPSLDVGSGAGFTIEGWINPANVTSNQPLVEWNANNEDVGIGVHMWISIPVPYGGGPGCLFANLKNPANNFILNTGPGLVTNGGFQHVALTYDKPSGMATLYYNGAIVAQAVSPIPNYTPATTADLYFGKRIAETPTTVAAAGTVFGGLMDEMSLYNTALSASQIQAIYNAGSAGKCAVPPAIVSEPQNQTTPVGANVTFAVGATGSQPLSYQWFINQTGIPMATNATLVLTNVQPANAGGYSVTIANLAGTTNSSSASLTVNAPVTCDPPPSGLVGWWAAEGNANDSFGANNGTLQGGMSFANGEVGQAFQFDGATGYVKIPASSSLDVGSGAGFTVEGWINPANVTSNQPLVEWNANNEDVGIGVHLWISLPVPGAGPGSLFANLKNPANNFILNTGPGLVTNGGFQHVALTYDKPSGMATLYYNGAIVAQAVSPYPNYTPATTADLYLGKRIAELPTTIGAAGTVFGGLMDEMSIYSVALSSSQIQAIYNAGGAGKCPVPPVIVSEPQNATVVAGSPASFSVGATGSQPLIYQWFINQTGIPMATNATLVLTNVQAANTGSYSVTIANLAGITNSSSASLTVLSASCTPPPSGLVSWWAAEGNANDSFGTNNGVVQGNLAYAPGEVGQAFQFDGTSAAIRVPASSSTDVGANGGLTIEGWIKPASLTVNEPLAVWDNGTDNLGVHLWINQPPIWSGTGPGSIIISLDDTSGVLHYITSPGNILSTNNWNHVAVTYDRASGTAAMYLNGSAVAVENLGVFTPSTGDDFYLGYAPPSPSFGVAYYTGLMDEMSLYNAALSSNQIQAIYLAGSAGKCAVPPVIVGEPQNQTAPVGANVTFAVGATGSQPLIYQWFINQTGIPMATNATLVLTDVQLGQSGNNYSVQVSNPLGMTNSSGALLTVNAPICDAPPSGLVSWWAAEGNANDSFGTNNAVVLGNLAYAPGEVGQAFQFDGTLAGLRVPASASMDVGTNGGLTIEGWIKPASLTVNEPLAVWNNGTDNWGVHFQLNQPPIWDGNGPGSMFADINDTSGTSHSIASPANVLSTNSWNHVALTYDRASGTAALYLNGSAVTVENVGSFTPLTTWDFYLGYSPQDPSFGLYYYTGLMDEMSLYNTALSAAQIQAIYLAGSAGKCSLRIPPMITLEPISQLVQPGCTVTFSSGATGSGTLNYQWQFNGTNLPAQNGTNLTLLNVQPADFGNYTMIASNACGSAASAVAVLALDHPPVPGSIVIQRFPHSGVRMNTSDILAGATDADGDLLSVLGVATNSAGGRVTLNGPSIYYMPPPGLTNADSFNYTISDGHCGGTAVGSVLVEVRGDSNPACSVTMVRAGNGSMQVIFDGMPGVAYRVQTTDTLTPPNWQDVTTLVAGQYGTCIYEDWPATNGPVRYFRSVSP